MGRPLSTSRVPVHAVFRQRRPVVAIDQTKRSAVPGQQRADQVIE
jgi:hypothetical protein